MKVYSPITVRTFYDPIISQKIAFFLFDYKQILERLLRQSYFFLEQKLLSVMNSSLKSHCVGLHLGL